MSVKDSSGNEIINVFRRADHGAVISYRNIDYTMARHDGRYEQTFAATNTIRVFKDETTGELSKDFKSLKCHKSRNLFDINAVTIDKFINSEGIETNSTAENVKARLSHSDFIDVSSGSYITMLYTGDIIETNEYATLAFCWYDTNKSFISSTEFIMNTIWNASHTQYTMYTIVPDGISYCIVNIAGYNNTNKQYMLNTGTSPLPYEPYGELYSADLKDYTIYGDTVNGEFVGDKTTNLFDGYRTTDIINNSYIDKATGNNISNNDYYISYPIAVIANQNYVWTFNSFRDGAYWKHSAPTVGFYDVNNVLISAAMHDNSINSFMFTVPDNCSYIRASVYKRNSVNKTEAMLNTGSTALPYEPYGYKVPVTVEGKNLFDENTVEKNKYIYNGSLNNSTSSNVSDYIPIKNNSTYILSWSANTLSSINPRQMAIYNSQKEYLDFIDIYVYRNATIQLNALIELNIANAAYIRITFDTQMTNIMLNLGSAALPYEPYQSPVTTNIYIPEPLKSIYNGDSPYYTDYINYKKQILHKEGINKFASDWEVGTISTSTGENESSNSYYRTKDYIPLDPRGWYTFARAVTGTVMVFGYDENKNYVGHDTDIDVELYSSTTFQNDFAPYGVAYLKFVQAYPGQLPENWHYMLLEGYFESESSLPPYEPCIDGDTPVTLPALPTLYKTNTISVETTVAPSRADFTGHIKTISGGS